MVSLTSPQLISFEKDIKVSGKETSSTSATSYDKPIGHLDDPIGTRPEPAKTTTIIQQISIHKPTGALQQSFTHPTGHMHDSFSNPTQHLK